MTQSSQHPAPRRTRWIALFSTVLLLFLVLTHLFLNWRSHHNTRRDLNIIAAALSEFENDNVSTVPIGLQELFPAYLKSRDVLTDQPGILWWRKSDRFDYYPGSRYQSQLHVLVAPKRIPGSSEDDDVLVIDSTFRVRRIPLRELRGFLDAYVGSQ